MTLPFLTNEDGDPIGFILDAEGRYVKRPGFVHTSKEVADEGLEPGDEVWVEGECVLRVPLRAPSRSSGAFGFDLNGVSLGDDYLGTDAPRQINASRWAWPREEDVGGWER